jgi:C-terminal processing protease CtpA/Prc
MSAATSPEIARAGAPSRALAPIVVAVTPGSPADAVGLVAGDEVLTLNGEDLRDVIRYQVQADEPVVEV